MIQIGTRLLLALALCLSPLALAAEPPLAKPMDQPPYQDLGDYRVHFSTFTSDFLQPATAAALKLSRAKNQVLLNVSLTRRQGQGYSLGQRAQVSGTASNLMQQQRRLQFQQVAEADATYYLAPLRVDGEEVIHFALTVTAEDGTAIPVNFTRTLHAAR